MGLAFCRRPLGPALVGGLLVSQLLTLPVMPLVYYFHGQDAGAAYSTSKSKRYLRWLVKGSSTYYLYAFVAFFLAALISSLI